LPPKNVGSVGHDGASGVDQALDELPPGEARAWCDAAQRILVLKLLPDLPDL
jgi:hypothetical protein